MFEEVADYSMNNEGINPTTVEVLKFFCELNMIFIQDAAAVMNTCPDRVNHPQLKELLVFQMEAFQTCIGSKACSQKHNITI